MDGERFDGLTKAVARGVSRRQLLAGVAGGIAGFGLRDQGQVLVQSQITEDECRAHGWMVQYEYGKCSDATDGWGCGLFQYHWAIWCDVGQGPGYRKYVGSGCGFCLL